MNDRLNQIILEIEQKCKEVNCFEFEYYWEVWGVMWYPLFIEINGKSESFSFKDISNNDLEILCTEGLIELVKEYEDDEKHKDEFDKKRYRLKSR